jgi:hypothetical protein
MRFASSPDAGRLVLQIVACVMGALLVAAWTLGQINEARRMRREHRRRQRRLIQTKADGYRELFRTTGTK